MVVTLREAPALPNAATFLVEVGDDSLEPEFRRGARLYVDTRQPAQSGDTVVLVIDRAPAVAVLLGRAAAHLRIRQGACIVEVAVSRIAAVYRIVPLTELLL